jgi:hypothetical protein
MYQIFFPVFKFFLICSMFHFRSRTSFAGSGGPGAFGKDPVKNLVVLGAGKVYDKPIPCLSGRENSFYSKIFYYLFII